MTVALKTPGRFAKRSFSGSPWFDADVKVADLSKPVQSSHITLYQPDFKKGDRKVLYLAGVLAGVQAGSTSVGDQTPSLTFLMSMINDVYIHFVARDFIVSLLIVTE